ncbi:isocitrate lyase/PEP mutase family protein [Clostridium botulinum]|uniref:isocitrate lyase/PEP mutase family protein n=1 Tax=Clostridium botulinum TaxID=1491 RepID=UPI0009B02A97|nr:isocitrate lyase/phosphoenolpyruvate mutase family protein [Clostridium botulinum]
MNHKIINPINNENTYEMGTNMDITKQLYLAKQFQEIHHRNKMFILPNAWDVGSAVIYEKFNFPAVGTTSAGLAYSLGYSDGEKIDFEHIVQIVKQITQRISIPLSVDIELGYADTIDGIVENVTKLIEAGAVGINIEDGYSKPAPYLENLDIQIKKIQAISKLKKKLGIPFVLNARTCVFFIKAGKEEERLSIAIERANAFHKSGADCIFIPGAIEECNISKLIENIPAPINILATPMANNLENLERLGVRRLSLGSAPVRAAYSNLIETVKQIQDENKISKLLDHDFSYEIANKLFAH